MSTIEAAEDEIVDVVGALVDTNRKLAQERFVKHLEASQFDNENVARVLTQRAGISETECHLLIDCFGNLATILEFALARHSFKEVLHNVGSLSPSLSCKEDI